MVGLYSLRRADLSVKLAAILFLLVLGYSYVFAFLMVRDWAGLTPTNVAATYVPSGIDESAMSAQSQSATQELDLNTLEGERHTIDSRLLIQDSHIHIMIYAIVAALESLIILGLEWAPWWRNTMIGAAFITGALDFAGQWLMKAGIGGFAWLTIASGWGMATVYLVILVRTAMLVVPRARIQEGTT
jgi:hypothetical protein